MGSLTRSSRARPARWFGVCLIVAVFFLPLHFHAATAIAAQVTKECICLHGSRTHATLTALPAGCAPAIVAHAVAPFAPVEIDSESIRIPSSRAPPA